MIKTISKTTDTVLVVDGTGAVKTARADHPKWGEISTTFNQIGYESDHFTGPVDRLLELMDLKTAVESYTVGLLSVNSLGVTYAGRPLHTVDAERVMAFMRDKLSYTPIANYIARKMKNPSARAIQEMYDFMEHKGMPLTVRGTFLAYKGVTPDFWSINGNLDTVVLQGTVDSAGRLHNKIGDTVEVERSSVDDDFRQGCSHGLHAGSLAYAKGWGSRVVLVEIDPADVVSVPEDCSCQKLRCCKYVVVAEYTGPMPDTLVTEFEDPNELDVCHTCGATNGECDCDRDKIIECVECKKEIEASRISERESDGMLPTGPEETIVIPPKQSEIPDESWIREKAKVEGKSIVAINNIPLSKESARDFLGLTLTDTYTKVIHILSEVSGANEYEITPMTKMEGGLLQLDSLDGVELVKALEEEFRIEISDEDAEKATSVTVLEIVKYIEQRLERERARTIPVPAAYAQGHKDGIADKVRMMGSPKWMAGDWDGADSHPHFQYILGYVAGYAK